MNLNIEGDINFAINKLNEALSMASSEFERDDFPPDWDADLTAADDAAQDAISYMDVGEEIARVLKMLQRIAEYDKAHDPMEPTK